MDKASVKAIVKEITRVRLLLVGLCVGGALLLADVVVTLFRSYPVFFRERHFGGTIGFLLAAGSGAVLLWHRSRRRTPAKENGPGYDWKPNQEDSLGDIELAAHVLEYIEIQIAYYNNHGVSHSRLYWSCKVPSLVSASLVPVFALQMSESFKTVTAMLGAIVVISEGLIQIGRYHDNWVTGIAARDGLERERELFVAEVGPYANIDLKKRTVLLSERASALMN
jgi:hypothetical protein